MSTPENLFIAASRSKMRFATERGELTVEDLWDLPLTSNRNISLDEVAVNLNNELQKQITAVSFVRPASSEKGAEIETKFEIVKHIISVKLAEMEQSKQLIERAAKKRQLEQLLEAKIQQGMQEMSIEEIKAQLAAL